MTTGITDSSPEITGRQDHADEMLHRIAADAAAIRADVAELRSVLDEFRPVLAGLRTNGLLGARRAARNQGGYP